MVVTFISTTKKMEENGFLYSGQEKKKSGAGCWTDNEADASVIPDFIGLKKKKGRCLSKKKAATPSVLGERGGASQASVFSRQEKEKGDYARISKQRENRGWRSPERGNRAIPPARKGGLESIRAERKGRRGMARRLFCARKEKKKCEVALPRR